MSWKRTIGLGLVLVSVFLGACATTGGSGSQNRNVLSSWELTEVADLTAMEAVRQLRPAWLRTRGGGGPISGDVSGMYGVRLHVDGSTQRSLDVLDTIYAGDVREMRYLDGSEATTRFGTGYTNGVILVTTER